MNLRLSLALIAAGLFGGVLGTALDVQAAPPAGQVFSECVFARTTWHPDHAPPGIPGKFVGLTPVPEGWTPVGGSMGSYPSMFICRP